MQIRDKGFGIPTTLFKKDICDKNTTNMRNKGLASACILASRNNKNIYTECCYIHGVITQCFSL